MKPKVSIIMPVLNGERYIAEAIESILAQTYTNYELIVVDDGSTDRTSAVVQSFGDRLELEYVSHLLPQGIAPSMNDGVRHASGDLIAFLDHDDAWFPEFLETQVDYLNRHPDVAMVHSDFQTVDVQGVILEASVAACRKRKRPSGHVFRELFLDSFIVGNSVLIRKECFERLGLFDESLRWGDYHMWMRIARHYRVDYVPKVLTKYRQHPSQSTRTASDNVAPVALQAIDKIIGEYPAVRRELGSQVIRRRRASLYFDAAYAWWIRRAARQCRSCLAHAIASWPWNWRYYAMYAACLLPPSQSMAARDAWRRLRGLKTSIA